MRIYISGPITGHPNYKKRFEEAQKALEAQGLEVVNPARLDCIIPATASHTDFMKVCIPLVNISDAIYMLEGWEASKGAQMEFEYACHHKLAVTFEGGRA